MKECLSRSRNPFRCISFWLLISVFLLMVAISTIAQTRSADSPNIVPGRNDLNEFSFTYRPSYPEAGKAVQFTDSYRASALSWDWDFGDGKRSSLRNPFHSFSKPGFYGVTLTVGSHLGKRRVKRTIVVMPPTDVSFSFSPPSPKIGQPIQFTDTTSGSPTSWLWQFGDGTTSTAQNPRHAYKAVASYTVTLVTGTIVGSERETRTLTVSAATSPVSSLSSSFIFSPRSSAPGQAVQFTGMSGGSPTSWLWDFNDGSTSTVQNPNHTYTAAGTYNVTLTVANDSGSTSTSLAISVGLVEAITAASPSLADVSAAIAKAKPGDTVMVPAGSATWTANTEFSAWSANLVIRRGINLIGAGIGHTNITFSAPFGIVYQPSAEAVAADDAFRISGFTFDHSGSADWGRGYGAICLYGTYYTKSLAKNRIDHIRFYKDAGTAITVSGPLWGVADSCQLDYISNPYRSYFISLRATGGDRNNWDNFPVDAAHPFGQADQFYMEDCIFNGNVWFEGGQGGRYCVRHCTGYGQSENDLFDVHGNQPAGGIGDNYATMKAEIYDNVFQDMTYWVRLVAIRGGKVLVYNNALIGNSTVSQSFLNSYEEYSDFRSPTNDATVSIQHPNDCYLFNNTKNGVKFTDLTISGTVDYSSSFDAPYAPNPPYRVVPQKDKDIWWEQSSFNGSSGVGVGLLSARPSSGLSVGVGYWATDTKTLYRWTATKVWEEYYKPYIYPHPLRSR